MDYDMTAFEVVEAQQLWLLKYFTPEMNDTQWKIYIDVRVCLHAYVYSSTLWSVV